MKYKVGDRIIANKFSSPKYSATRFGWTGVVTSVSPHLQTFCATTVGGSDYCFGLEEEYFDLVVTSSQSSNMNLKEKFSLAFKGEPEKSFIEAGVMNSDESLTTDGKELFLSYLLKKNGDDFKTTVIDPILAEQTND